MRVKFMIICEGTQCEIAQNFYLKWKPWLENDQDQSSISPHMVAIAFDKWNRWVSSRRIIAMHLNRSQSIFCQWGEENYILEIIWEYQITFKDSIQTTRTLQSWWLSDNILPIDGNAANNVLSVSIAFWSIALAQDARGTQQGPIWCDIISLVYLTSIMNVWKALYPTHSRLS